MKPPRPPYLTPSKSSACISHNWILPHHPSQMTLASDSAEPLPYAKRFGHWRTIYSMTGLPLKTIYPSNFKHFGTFEKNSVSQTAYFWKPLGPLSPLCYAHPCWPRSIIHIGVLNTAFVLPEMLYSGPTCPRTLKNSATPARLATNTESRQLPSQCYHIPFQLFHGNLSPKTYLHSGTNST